MNRQTRIQRQIADIQETWSKEEKAQLVDRIHYNGLLEAARDVTMTQTVDYADVITEISQRRKLMNQPEGLQTGIPAIDKMLYGLRNGELIVIAGPSSHGKTAIALNMAVKTLETNPQSRVLFISLEMDYLEIFSRADHIASSRAILAGRLRVQMQRRLTTTNIGNIIAAYRDYDVIFIDHLHMLTRPKPGLSAYEATSLAVEEIKTLANEYRRPIVLLSHVRKQRSGSDGQATVADLQGSGAIEQMADFVLMVNADATDRRIKRVTLGKSRTKMTTGEGHTEVLTTDGLKILPEWVLTV